MEISVGNSGCSKTKSLDLKTLYKSEVSNKGGSVKSGNSSWLENGEGIKTKKRKSRKEVPISSFEDLTESKRIRHSVDGTEVDAPPSELDQRIYGGSGFNAIGTNIHDGGHGVLIPKRPRGSVGRSKFAKSHSFKPSAASVEKVPKLKDEVSAEQIVKLNEKSGVKARTTQNKVPCVKSDNGDLVKPISSLGSKDQISKVKLEIMEISQEEVPDADAPLDGSSLGSKDQVAKSKYEIKEIFDADAPLSSNFTSADQLRNNSKKKGIDALDGNHKQKEEGTDLVVNNKDGSSNGKHNHHRKRKMSGSAKKVESSGPCDLDPDDDLEQNAARMLSSRFDPSCTGFASKNRTSALSSMNHGPFLGKPTAERVLRPRRQQKGKGISRKRRHFYEIQSDDMDALWFLDRKIKIFWPLDESWYYGQVNDYDAVKKLHHIKYDDRDEEWISLKNERFKLLILPSEVPHKPSGKDPAVEDSHVESEPIIAWLARSSNRVKPSSLKKQNRSHFPSESHRLSDNFVYDNETMSSSTFLNISTDRKKNEKSVPIVYIRSRYRRFSDRGLDSYLFGLKNFEIHVSLWPMLRYVLGSDILWLLHNILLHQYGTMVTMWPNVFLEVLFVDNFAGLRLFLFEGCLTQAVAFVFLVLKVFCEPEKGTAVGRKIPVTTIRFKLSFFQKFKRQKVFAYYSFSKARDSDWRYLDSEFRPHCLLAKRLSLRECTHDNVKLLETGTQHEQIPYAGQTSYFEVSRKTSNPGIIHGSRPSTIYSFSHGNLPPFALSITATPNFFLSLHLKLLLDRSINGGPRNSSQFLDANLNVNRPFISSKAAQSVPAEISNSEMYKGISVKIPTSADLTWNLSDGIICSPNPTGPRSLWHSNKSGSNSSPFGDPLNSWTDGMTNFIGNGPKKPRTQVHYTMPSNFKNKGHNNQIGLPYQRIRKANDNRVLSDGSKGPRRNLELVACDVNILINGGDKGWRESGARVFLEVAYQNEWKLVVRRGGELKYSYKVVQDLQPGSTNRYTHAMMWKGGKDWALEFPDRSQWFVFKEMHEECHNRNIRAASIKNIPIPGVRLIEDVGLIEDAGDVEMTSDKTLSVRSPWYFRQVRNDVEMAMDGSRVVYDMDSEDEEWVSGSRASYQTEVSEEDTDKISDEVFEKVMDMFEKVSYAQKRDHFTSGNIEEMIAGVCSVQAAKSIYEHWWEKRQRKGMPLIRQLQPPLWEKYQQIYNEWAQSKPKSTTGPLTGSQEKASAGEKPPMFAFCLKPRGLELLNKGSKHRPHKKISLSGHIHTFLPDHDTHHSSERRVNAYTLGDERAGSPYVSPLVNKMYSPRDAAGPAHFFLDGNASDPRIQRSNPKTIKTVVSPKMKVGKRNNSKKLIATFRESDLDEFRLRDASSAAKHARNMAKLKRERAQKLMLSADLAIHKAVSALMTAEAVKSCTQGHDVRKKSTSQPSTR